jgi:isoquinoline 1-oxidoreductase beta subunit
VVEVAVDAQGKVKVVAVDMAIDCGPQVNPERIRAQMEGAAVMGLSLAFTGEITFEAGTVSSRATSTTTRCCATRSHPASSERTS